MDAIGIRPTAGTLNTGQNITENLGNHPYSIALKNFCDGFFVQCIAYYYHYYYY